VLLVRESGGCVYVVRVSVSGAVHDLLIFLSPLNRFKQTTRTGGVCDIAVCLYASVFALHSSQVYGVASCSFLKCASMPIK